MLFNSLQFAIFLPIVFIIYWILPHRFRWVLLLFSSYYFYMSWNIRFVVLILFTTVVSYAAALMIEKTDNVKRKKAVLSTALVLCLCLLFFFKYLDFFWDSLSAVLSVFAIKLNPLTIKLILPVGISFYTFQTIGYVIDVYRGTVSAEKNFGIYATFVSFFPQLVAGPIERTGNLLPQIREKHVFSYEQATYGLKLMALGFFKKMVIADNLAVCVDSVYNNLYSRTGFALVLAAAFFSIQIYCDFSGYSDIARGTAKLMGIELTENFRSPYFSTTIKELWGKWHISLSTWFRDYIYIPLGGNRVTRFRYWLNLLVTFLISGLWHGASWMYVIWGGIHGMLQIAESIFRIRSERKIGTFSWFLRVILVFIVTTCAFVFFRATSLGDAMYVFRHMIEGFSSPIAYFELGIRSVGFKTRLVATKTVLAVVLLSVFDFFSLKTDVIKKVSALPVAIRWMVYYIMLIFIFACARTSGTQFIYFQF